MRKITRINEDGIQETAILISSGGGSWFSQQGDLKLLYQPDLIEAILSNEQSIIPLSRDELHKVLGDIAQRCELPSLPYLMVCWVLSGTKFTVIPTWDGDEEEIVFHDACTWSVA